MAKKGKVIATLKKRDKKKPFAYVDKSGHVRHATRKQFIKKRNKSKQLCGSLLRNGALASGFG